MVGTSIDGFFKGLVKIEQPKNGYRAGMDAALLACAAGAVVKTNICELGCGVGTAIIGALALNGDKSISAAGIEIDELAIDLFAKNLARNNIKNEVYICKSNGLKPIVDLDGKFDLVISNPPFFDDESQIRGPHIDKKSAYIIGAPLLDWIKAMLRLCSAKGEILIIHRADRLYDILSALKGRAGDVRIIPIYPNAQSAATRVLIKAKKANRAPMQILNPIILHPTVSQLRFAKMADEMFNGGGSEYWDCLK